MESLLELILRSKLENLLLNFVCPYTFALIFKYKGFTYKLKSTFFY